MNLRQTRITFYMAKIPTFGIAIALLSSPFHRGADESERPAEMTPSIRQMKSIFQERQMLQFNRGRFHCDRPWRGHRGGLLAEADCHVIDTEKAGLPFEHLSLSRGRRILKAVNSN
jgi:hypothetical protein